VALPAVHWKVTVEEAKVDPGAGLTITAEPEPGVAVGVGVGVPLGVGVAVGVGVGEPPVVASYPMTSITRRSTGLKSFLTLELQNALKESFVPLAQS